MNVNGFISEFYGSSQKKCRWRLWAAATLIGNCDLIRARIFCQLACRRVNFKFNEIELALTATLCNAIRGKRWKRLRNDKLHNPPSTRTLRTAFREMQRRDKKTIDMNTISLLCKWRRVWLVRNMSGVWGLLQVHNWGSNVVNVCNDFSTFFGIKKDNFRKIRKKSVCL